MKLNWLRKKNVVGISLLKDKVYLANPDVKVMESGVEYEVIGTPVPMILQPVGCSPDYGSSGNYYTAQHCIGIRGADTVQVYDPNANKTYTAKVVKQNPWKPLSFFSALVLSICEVLKQLFGVNCTTEIPVNKDWAIIDIGNEGDAPIGILSGGTIPPGITFFAPLVNNPEQYVGKKLKGTSYDYDARQYVTSEWEIFDYGIIKYGTSNEMYLVEAWYTRGFSKPGFSGTNAYAV